MRILSFVLFINLFFILIHLFIFVLGNLYFLPNVALPMNTSSLFFLSYFIHLFIYSFDTLTILSLPNLPLNAYTSYSGLFTSPFILPLFDNPSLSSLFIFVLFLSLFVSISVNPMYFGFLLFVISSPIVLFYGFLPSSLFVL